MKAIAIPLAVASALFAANASAHGDRDDDYRDYRYEDYRYAPPAPGWGYPQQDAWVKVKVVDVDRVPAAAYADGRYGCDPRSGRGVINTGTVAGAVIGGVVGNQIGQGDGRALATVAGAALGGLIGHNLDRNDKRAPVDCHQPAYARNAPDMYRVTYRYQGGYYTTWLPYRPGKHLQLRRQEIGQPYRGQYATRW